MVPLADVREESCTHPLLADFTAAMSATSFTLVLDALAVAYDLYGV